LSANEFVRRFVQDWCTAPLDNATHALLAFAEKCTRAPNSPTPADLDALRTHGFSDSDLHDAVQVIGYFNYINRVADALGIEPDAWLIEFEKELNV